MNGWSLKTATSTPVRSPAAAPMPSVAGTESQNGHCKWIAKVAKHTDARASTLDTDRSIPAVTITSVMPQASMP